MQFPIGSENSFKGVVVSLTEKAIYYDDEMGKDERYSEIPEELKSEVAEWRFQMVEKIAEMDDDLMMAYLDNESIEIDDLKKVLRKAVIQNRVTPVFCGSALRNKGGWRSYWGWVMFGH